MKKIITLFFLALSICGYTQNKLFVNGGTATGIGTSTNSFIGIGPSNPTPTTHLHIMDSYNGELSLLIQNTYSPGTRTFLTSMPTRSLIQTDKDFGISTNGGGWSEKLTVLNNGNVGIGIISPVSPLHIGSANASIRIGLTGDAGNLSVLRGSSTKQYNLDFSGYRDSSPDQIGARIAALRFNNYQDNNALIQNTGLAFFTNPSGINGGTVDLQERMRILPDGKIGIGTTAPDASLAVKGTIHSQEVKVDMQGSMVPDYVFEKEYALPTLESVKTYIDQNKHLPEVPSAKEMEANGINLSEMNMLLLKKVEELTIYAIEANKKIEKLELRLSLIENK